MAKPRSYNLLCPIARALDALGDRWSLLILRDLHAGPARFADLQSGLSGIASNLLTDRLVHLAGEGLIEKVPGPHGITLYQLTEAGQATRGLLFALAKIGGRREPVAAPRRPGNLRTIAVTLAAALDQVVSTRTDAQAELDVDGECFAISVRAGKVSVLAGANLDARVRIETGYDALMAAASGALPFERFAAENARITADEPDDAKALAALLGAALASMR